MKEIEIPEGYEARIDGNKVIIELKMSEDEKIRKNLIELLLDTPAQDIISHNLELSKVLAYLEKQKDQKPAEWSDEDKRIKQDIENLIHFALRDGSAVSPAANTTKEDAINWFKSLPERFNLQPKQEWSDEDEDMLKSIIASCQLAAQDRDSGPAWKLYEMQERFLKSLYPQPHWKPSEEQMNLLDKIYHYLWADRNATADMQDGLGNFIDDLKKL